MSELSAEKSGRKGDWSLSRAAFRRLLGWLDAGEDSEGEKYEEMRRRLLSYFDRKGCAAPDELADETLNRVARRLEEEGSIECDAPAQYCYITARFVFMEYLRSRERGGVPLESVPPPARRGEFDAAGADEERRVRERMLDCLELCTEGLDAQSRQLITRYYAGTLQSKIAGRRALAAELGLSQNALSIRACRIRVRLEACVRDCVRAALK